MSKKPPRLRRTATLDLPVVEASGLATRFSGERVEVLVVGDRTATVAAGAYDPSAGTLGEWTTFDLSELADWPLPADDSQMEAIAADGGSLLGFMSEEPPVVLIADADDPRFVARIKLVAPPGSPLDGDWDDPSSRGEGLVLLRGGRLLVAKEKRPSELVEFSPLGMPARGVSRDDFLEPHEPWDCPVGEVDFVATSLWRLEGDASRLIEDISALAVARDRSLWLLSDKSESVARLRLDTPLRAAGGTIERFDEVWRLPKGTTKPEGIAPLDDHRVLVAMDTGSTRGNGMIVERPR